MRRVFVDCCAWYAFARQDDADHAAFRRLVEEWQGRLVTSNFIFNETITLIRMRGGHAAACRMGEVLREAGVVDLVRVTAEDEDDAWSWFSRHRDKAYSFTDCTTFALMRRLKIQAVLSSDRHFLHAGFLVLPALT